jgi:hypothetical protein
MGASDGPFLSGGEKHPLDEKNHVHTENSSNHTPFGRPGPTSMNSLTSSASDGVTPL